MNAESKMVHNGVSRFLEQEADKICERKNAQLRTGIVFLVVGVVALIVGGVLQANGTVNPPIPGLLMLAGICMLPSGLMISIKMSTLKRKKILKQLEGQLLLPGLSPEKLDEEMEQYGGFSNDKPILVTERFVVVREPLMTKAVDLEKAFWISGTFMAQNKKNTEKGSMLYDGTGSVDEHTKEGYSRIRGQFSVEYFDQNGEPIRDFSNKKCITKTGKERETKLLLQEIHRTHPWIFMGREQMNCTDESNLQKSKAVYEERKRQSMKA